MVLSINSTTGYLDIRTLYFSLDYNIRLQFIIDGVGTGKLVVDYFLKERKSIDWLIQ